MRTERIGCTVRIASPLRSYATGAATLPARGGTLAEVLSSLEQRCPGIRFRMIDEQDRIRPHLRLFVNNSEARELSAAVCDGDTVHLICALSGG
jgi:molybdopterin synthase sulfur carrier subunit